VIRSAVFSLNLYPYGAQPKKGKKREKEKGGMPRASPLRKDGVGLFHFITQSQKRRDCVKAERVSSIPAKEERGKGEKE